MRQAGSQRWAWTGVGFFVVFAVAVIALSANAPGETASAQKVMAYYNSHRGRILADVFLSPAIVTLLLLYITHLRARTRDAGVTSDMGPNVMFAGAVVWAGGGLLGSVLELMSVSASRHGQAQIAQTANVLSNDTWIPFIAGVAVTLIGIGIAVLGSSVLPKWMGYVALVAGVISLAGPGGFIGFFVAPLFILASSIMLLRTREIDLTDRAVPVPAQAQAEAPAAQV